MEKKFNTKKALMIAGIIIVLIFVAIATKRIIDFVIVQNEMKTAEHAITINTDVHMYSSAKEKKKFDTISIGSNTYLLKKVTDKDGKDWYKVSINQKVGYVKAEDVATYKPDYKEKELMVDVSKFNMQKNFKSIDEFKALVIKNNIKYVYIRAGGRGYGQAGNFYNDPNANDYANACEFLSIPFGYYFLDEAIDSKEVDEEAKFINDYVNEHSYRCNVLPIAIDVEKHAEEGRADKIWDRRAALVNELIEKLKLNNKRAILYSNAKVTSDYLSTVNAKMWLAYYPGLNEVPDNWITDIEIKGSKIESVNPQKIVGWQFTEKGIDSINTKIDLSVVYSKELMYDKVINVDDFINDLVVNTPDMFKILGF